MAIKVGISGFGRISRVVIRIAMSEPDIEIAGINIRNADYDYLVYMLKYDSTFGRFPGELGTYENGITINGRKVPVYSESDAANIPWSECGAEYIIEGTGAYTTTEKAMAHIEKGGAKKVIISAPAKDAETPTFVYGVNHMEYKPEYKVVSNASCTTNCLAPLSKVLEDNWGRRRTHVYNSRRNSKTEGCRCKINERLENRQKRIQQHHSYNYRSCKGSSACYPVTQGQDDRYRIQSSYCRRIGC